MSDLDLDSLSELEERCLVNGGLTDAEIRDVFSLAREARRLREVISKIPRWRNDRVGENKWFVFYDDLEAAVGLEPVVSTEEKLKMARAIATEDAELLDALKSE